MKTLVYAGKLSTPSRKTGYIKIHVTVLVLKTCLSDLQCEDWPTSDKTKKKIRVTARVIRVSIIWLDVSQKLIKVKS